MWGWGGMAWGGVACSRSGWIGYGMVWKGWWVGQGGWDMGGMWVDGGEWEGCDLGRVGVGGV